MDAEVQTSAALGTALALVWLDAPDQSEVLASASVNSDNVRLILGGCLLGFLDLFVIDVDIIIGVLRLVDNAVHLGTEQQDHR